MESLSRAAPSTPNWHLQTNHQDGICGMTLEPRTISLAEEENIELKEMVRRFWLNTLLALPLSLPL